MRLSAPSPSPPQLMNKGGVLSITTIVRAQVELLPQSSVAVHVRVILYVPVHVPCVVVLTKEIVTLGSQASTALAIPNSGTAGQEIGLATSGQVISGAVLSSTVKVAVV